MTRLYSNNASTTLVTAVNNTDDPVTFSVAAGTGDLFPAITGSDTFIVALQDASGTIEYLEVTARTGDQMTATRAQDGSTIAAFSIGDVCDLRLIADDLTNFAQKGASLDLGGNTLSNAAADSTCSWTGGTMQAGAYAAQDGGASNVINVPNSGGAPNINGVRILTTDDIGAGSPELDALYKTIYPVGIVVLFNSSMGNPNTGAPAGVIWAQVTNAYERYLRFSSTPGSQFNVLGQVTGIGGEHQHGSAGRTLGHALTTEEIPAHRHSIYTGAQQFRVAGPGPGIPTAPGTPIGVIAAGRDTGFEGGVGGATQEHSHAIEAHSGHEHPIDPQPNGYTLVPWVRTS